MKNILPSSFYASDTVSIARALLGTCLVHKTKAGLTAGRIIETEAYLFKDDPACHAHKGRTPRNAAMFGKPGHAYIYFIYGLYHCFNVVTAPENVGEAVLIRALEPLAGLPLMESRRGTRDLKNLCSGPAKLVIALGITRALNGAPLTSGALTLQTRDSFSGCPDFEIVQSHRIGITTGVELPLRFCIKGSRFLSAHEDRIFQRPTKSATPIKCCNSPARSI